METLCKTKWLKLQNENKYYKMVCYVVYAFFKLDQQDVMYRFEKLR